MININLLILLSGYPKTFDVKTGVAVNTLVTSRKARLPASGAIGAASGFEYSLNGGAWTSSSGTWGSTKYAQIRFTSSASYSTSLTKNLVVGGVSYPFTIITQADPGLANTSFPYTFPFILD